MSKLDEPYDFIASRDQALEPLAVKVSTAGRLLDCGRSTIFEMLKSGKLERCKIGNSTRVTMASVRRAAQAKE